MSAAVLAPRRDLILSALRYGLAGVANTLVGFSVIAALQFGLGLNAHLANAGGYVIGVVVSFLSSRFFVFRGRKSRPRAPLRYGIAVAVAFAVNQGVLTLVGRLAPRETAWALLAQGAAIVSYTGALFLLSHYWVFAHHHQPDAPSDRDATWNA